EAMIEATEQALLAAGVKAERIHSERFSSPTLDALPREQRVALKLGRSEVAVGEVELTVLLDGKAHALRMGRGERVLDVALEAGLDLPWSCRAGVCCTRRAKGVEGS